MTSLRRCGLLLHLRKQHSLETFNFKHDSVSEDVFSRQRFLRHALKVAALLSVGLDLY